MMNEVTLEEDSEISATERVNIPVSAQSVKKHWKKEHLEILVEGYEKHKTTLQSKHKDSGTNEKKNKIWKSITAQINAVSDVKRTVSQVRKKWSDYSSITKGKESARRGELKRTGGGPLPKELTDLEQKAVGIIGETAVAGIKELSL